MKSFLKYKPNILHLLFRSLPSITGYSIRSHYILTHQKNYVNTFALTSPFVIRKNKQDTIENILYFRYKNNFLIDILFDSKLARKLKISILFEQMYNSTFKIPLFNIKKIVNQKNIEIIHGHTPESFAKFGEIVAHKKRIPFVYEVRGFWEDTFVGNGVMTEYDSEYKRTRLNETKLINKADKVITLGEMMKKEIISRGIDKEKIHIVPNAVDIKLFQPIPPDLELKRSLKIDNRQVIAYIGSIRKIEGIKVLIKAISIVKNEFKNILLMLIGSCTALYRSELDMLIKKHKLNKSVLFLDKINPNEIKKYYSIVDIIVIPRIDIRVCRLVPPLKHLEAMAMQKVVITSDLPALREGVKPGISGDIFNPGDHKELANKIIRYLSDTELKQKLGGTARNFVQKYHNWDKIIEKYYFIYKQLLEKN